jgi:hypothetical protein
LLATPLVFPLRRFGIGPTARIRTRRDASPSSPASLAGDRLKLLKEARELDHALGLTPKGMAALHWKIVADKKAAVVALVPELDDLDD